MPCFHLVCLLFCLLEFLCFFSLAYSLQGFDCPNWVSGIFFDTYGEYYEDMREFHQHLPKLLKPGGIYSFFNGLCGDNAFFHVGYCNLVSLELVSLGYTTQLIPLPVSNCLAEDVWKGVRQKYWQLDTYYLPVCQYTDDSDSV